MPTKQAVRPMPTPDAAVIDSIQTGRVQSLGQPDAESPHDRPWETGFFKSPVDHPVDVGLLGIAGDEVADHVNHGGPDKAILCYSSDNWPNWADDTPDLNTFGGAFGENLTLSGMTETDVCIGDQWVCEDVVLEVSQPRQPCWKLGRRHRMSDLPKRVVKTGRSGWYVRVIHGGQLATGQQLNLSTRPHPTWPVARANQMLYDKQRELSELRELAAIPQLAAAWREAIGGAN